jgi:hypothetical protein
MEFSSNEAEKTLPHGSFRKFMGLFVRNKKKLAFDEIMGPSILFCSIFSI